MKKPIKPTRANFETEGQYKAAVKRYHFDLYRWNLENNPNRLEGESDKSYAFRKKQFSKKAEGNNNFLMNKYGEWMNYRDGLPNESIQDKFGNAVLDIISAPLDVSHNLAERINGTREFQSEDEQIDKNWDLLDSGSNMVPVGKIVKGAKVAGKTGFNLLKRKKNMAQVTLDMASEFLNPILGGMLSNEMFDFFKESENNTTDMKNKKTKKVKYQFGGRTTGKVQNYIDSPAQTTMESQMMIHKAKSEAMNNPWTQGLDLLGNAAVQYGTSMMGGAMAGGGEGASKGGDGNPTEAQLEHTMNTIPGFQDGGKINNWLATGQNGAYVQSALGMLPMLAQMTGPGFQDGGTVTLQSMLGDNPSKSSIRSLQRDLKRGGMYSGKLDGVAGPKTKKAFESFSDGGKVKPKKKRSKGNIKRVQQLLKDQGYYEGEIDGEYGPKSEEAMKNFQKNSPSQSSGDVIPLPLKSLVNDLVNGGDNSITRESLTGDELDRLQEIIRKNLAKGKTSISYDDYETERLALANGTQAKGDKLSLYEKVTDPSYKLKTTIGRAGIAVTPQNDTIVYDQYNFNDAKNESGDMKEYTERVKKNPTLYGAARAAGSTFGSPEGEGAPVLINTNEGEDEKGYWRQALDYVNSIAGTEFAMGGTTPNVPVEVEGEEVGKTPDGQVLDFKGPSHEKGGIDVALPEGTDIFSKRIKVQGEDMAERARKREKKLLTLEKLSGDRLKDKVLMDSIARTKENNALEEQKDKQTQEIVKNAKAQIASLYGDPNASAQVEGQEGELEFKWGGTAGSNNDFPPFDFAFLNQTVPNFSSNTSTYHPEGLQHGVPNSGAQQRGEERRRGIIEDEEIAQLENDVEHMQGIDELVGRIPKKYEKKPSIDDYLTDFKSKEDAKQARDINGDGKVDFSESRVGGFLNNIFSKKEGTEDETATGNKKGKFPKIDMGDATALAGAAYSTFAPSKITEEMRANEIPNVNAFEGFGQDALATLEGSKGMAESLKESAMKELEDSRMRTTQLNRGGARGINQMRALDLAAQVQSDKQSNAVYDNYFKQLMGINSQESQLESMIDSKVMAGESVKNQADKDDQDAYYSAKAIDTATKGEGIQRIGKMLNDRKANTMAEKAVNDASTAYAYDGTNLVDKAGTTVMSAAQIANGLAEANAKLPKDKQLTREMYIEKILAQNKD